jgi:hypothetical protein
VEISSGDQKWIIASKIFIASLVSISEKGRASNISGACLSKFAPACSGFGKTSPVH